MAQKQIHAVTGAFGYSGRYIAQRLLAQGVRVRTLTNSPQRGGGNDSGIEVHGFHWDDPPRLVAALQGVDVLYNTYWVRFNHRGFSFAQAVKNTIQLFAAARAAGVRRVVHVSITNPDEKSRLEYFRGKATLEVELVRLGLEYAILRPGVLFGKEDILVNNIAWMLRRFPVFGVFGAGDYKLQPIYVDDLAELAVAGGAETESRTIQAIGPETFTYRGLVEEIGKIIGCRRPIISVPPAAAWMIGQAVGKAVGDVTITRDEIRGLMENRLFVDAPSPSHTRLTAWAAENREWLGRSYASELARRRNREATYLSMRGDG